MSPWNVLFPDTREAAILIARAAWPATCMSSSDSRCRVFSSSGRSIPALVVFVAATFPLVGCGSTPPIDLPLPKDARVVEVVTDYVPFQRSPQNRYAVVLRGREFDAPKGRGFRISTTEDVRREGTPIPDPFVDGDVDQITRLLVSKGYDVYRADMGDVTPGEIDGLLDRLAMVADDETRLFFAYSGEGDKAGLRTRTMKVMENRRLVPPDATITPEGLLLKLASIKGTKTLLLNACESGVFAEAARKDLQWRGVVIAACPTGYATTPYEPTGTSAIYASFLELYQDDPKPVKNLGTVNRLARSLLGLDLLERRDVSVSTPRTPVRGDRGYVPPEASRSRPRQQ